MSKYALQQSLARWEYLLRQYRVPAEAEKELNELGAQGWEVVGYSCEGDGTYGQFGMTFTLKRQAF